MGNRKSQRARDGLADEIAVATTPSVFFLPLTTKSSGQGRRLHNAVFKDRKDWPHLRGKHLSVAIAHLAAARPDISAWHAVYVSPLDTRRIEPVESTAFITLEVDTTTWLVTSSPRLWAAME